MPTGFGSLGPPQGGQHHHGHTHFWQRALSRGQFLRTVAGATGLALTSDLWMPALARAHATSGVLARPIPGGGQFALPQSTELFHVFAPAPANELSTITDFKGVIAAAHVQGPATRTLSNGATTTLYADYDLRFMQGRYIGVDGQCHHGTFSFF
jgi:hypothetical protein